MAFKIFCTKIKLILGWTLGIVVQMLVLMCMSHIGVHESRQGPSCPPGVPTLTSGLGLSQPWPRRHFGEAVFFSFFSFSPTKVNKKQRGLSFNFTFYELFYFLICAANNGFKRISLYKLLMALLFHKWENSNLKVGGVQYRLAILSSLYPLSLIFFSS